jgi:stage II sporulation protein D
MRRALAIAVAVLAAVASVATVPAAPKPPQPVFVLAGGGWGHGVGMSQWGALGQAKAGRDYRAILAHYYRGTEIAAAPAAIVERVRVLVGDGLASVTVASALAVFDGNGKRYVLPPGPVKIGPKLRLPVGADGKQVALTGPLTFRAAQGSFLTVAERSYRGDLRVAQAGAKLQLVNVVGLESYLLGVVPGEMPKDWPLEALKAQAVAARTYAIAHLVKAKSFDLYSDWRSQVYYGVASEAPGPSRAIAETRGEIVTYDGTPAQTFYFSSSGGRTISSLDAFGTDLPYLVSVDDQWDAVSPNYRWAPRLLTGAQLAKRFGLPGAVTDVTYVAGAPGRPAVVRLETAGGSTDVRLSDVRARLGLKSTGFRLGVLRFDPGAAPDAGGKLRLTGLARGIEDVVLERRGTAGVWVKVRQLRPAPDGTFAVALRLDATTVFRLNAVGLPGPSVTVRFTA